MAARLTRAKKRLASSGIPFATPARGPPRRAARRRRDRRLPRLHVRLPPGRRRRRRCASTSATRPSGCCASSTRLLPGRAGRPLPAGPPAPAALPPRHPPRTRRHPRSCCPTRTAPAGTAPRSPRASPSWSRLAARRPSAPARPPTAGTRRRRPSASPAAARRGVPAAGAHRRRARHRPDRRRHPLDRHRRPVRSSSRRLTGSPVVRLARAVAVAEASGPEAGLALLDGLDDALPRHHRVPAVRAELLVRAGHPTRPPRPTAQALDAGDQPDGTHPPGVPPGGAGRDPVRRPPTSPSRESRRVVSCARSTSASRARRSQHRAAHRRRRPAVARAQIVQSAVTCALVSRTSPGA